MPDMTTTTTAATSLALAAGKFHAAAEDLAGLAQRSENLPDDADRRDAYRAQLIAVEAQMADMTATLSTLGSSPVPEALALPISSSDFNSAIDDVMAAHPGVARSDAAMGLAYGLGHALGASSALAEVSGGLRDPGVRMELLGARGADPSTAGSVALRVAVDGILKGR